MENKRTYITNLSEDVYNFIKEPKSISKNIKYNSTFKNAGVFNRAYVDQNPDKIVFVYENLKIRRANSSYFFNSSNKRGFTFDKKTKKLNVWFGSNISEIPQIKDFFSVMEIDWFEDKLRQYLTKGGLEKILSGKITNPVDFCSNYLKMNRFKGASPKLFYRATKEAGGLSKIHLFTFGRVCIDINQFFIKIIESPHLILHNNIIVDTAYQAGILEEKINILWSTKRFKDIHKKFTDIIMDIEQETLEDKVVDYKNKKNFPQKFPKEIVLMDSKKEVFREGKTMNHCIYTNYWNRIENGEYVAFKIIHENGRATLGCRVLGDGLKFDQIYGIGNSYPGEELVNFAKTWVGENESQLSQVESENVEFVDMFEF